MAIGNESNQMVLFLNLSAVVLLLCLLACPLLCTIMSTTTMFYVLWMIYVLCDFYLMLFAIYLCVYCCCAAFCVYWVPFCVYLMLFVKTNWKRDGNTAYPFPRPSHGISASYPRVAHPPSPTLTAQRLLREQQVWNSI